jgi:hypothetical protein
MRRPTILAALAAALVVSSLPVTADAATTFTQVSLDVTVTGASVTATTRIAASSQVQVDQYGICARDAAWRNFDFPAKKAATISTSGTSFSATRTFPAGTFRYYPCVLSDGSWKSVGMKTFTVSTAPSGPTVLFSDDFSGTGAYDHSKWGEWSSATYNGSAAYGSIKPGDRAALDGQGHLSVPATPSTGTSISTKDDFTFKYGTITARMKVPTEGGYWPAFWTLNNNPDGHDSLPLGEADVHESYTALANYYHRGTHTWNNDQSWSSADDPACGQGHVFGEWHDYSAKFEPGQVTFYFDGVQCGLTTTKAAGGGKPYGFGPDVTRGNWLILTMAVGGAGGQQDGRATAPAQLLVDSVKVTSL